MYRLLANKTQRKQKKGKKKNGNPECIDIEEEDKAKETLEGVAI